MADTATAQIIQPPDRLRARVGSGFVGVDPSAVARAEAALQAMSNQFAGWLEEEVAKLEAARAALCVGCVNAAALHELHLRAHDLKGLGGTYGFPLVTRVCASLCRVLDDEAARANLPRALLDAHVAAVETLVRDGVRDAADAAGVELCRALEAKVAAHRNAGD